MRDGLYHIRNTNIFLMYCVAREAGLVLDMPSNYSEEMPKQRCIELLRHGFDEFMPIEEVLEEVKAIYASVFGPDLQVANAQATGKPAMHTVSKFTGEINYN